MSRQRKPWYRWRNLGLALLVCLAAVLSWTVYEVTKVYLAEPNPTVDSRQELLALATRTAGVSAGEGERAWGLLVEIFDAAESVRTEINEQYDAGVFEPRDVDDVELDYDRGLAGRALPEALDP